MPFALFAVAGGVVSDRVGRRRVMIASDVVRTLSQATVAVLLLTGSAEVWMLVVLSAVYGTAAAAFMPALIGLIPQTVPPDRLQEANALLGFTRSIASVAGPALAGILIAIGGPGDAIAVDAVTFALSAACLIALRPDRAAAVADAEEDDGFAARLRSGWREVRRRPWLASGLGAMAAYHVFVLPAVWILGPALAESDLGGASSWAIIVACFGLGTIAGNLARPAAVDPPPGARRRRRARRRRDAGGDHRQRPRHGRDRDPRVPRRHRGLAVLHALGHEHPGAGAAAPRSRA